MTSRGEWSAVLVTGMSGTGKSTVLAELARRGHAVIDTDEPGWTYTLATPDGPEPLWDLDRVRTVLEKDRTRSLFVAGCVVNQGALYESFDAVVLLTAPLNVLLARVSDRTNPFGSTVEDRDKIARDVRDHEPTLRAGATHEIDTSASVTEVADRLERIAI